MQIAPEVIELELLAQKEAVSITQAVKRAGVASTTYWRWVNEGKEPLAKTVRNVRAAIAELASERAAA